MAGFAAWNHSRDRRPMILGTSVYLLALDGAAGTPWPTTRLNRDDQARAGRFRRAGDQARFVAGRLLLERLVRDETGVEDWPLEIGPRGRPALVGRGAGRPDVNISHCPGLIAAAFHGSGRVGVDVEAVDRSVDALGLADRYFSPEEAAEVNAAPSPVRRRLFLRYWTAKEAAMKAIGGGLSIPLDQVRVDLSSPGLAFAPELGEDPAAWRLHTRDLGEHLLAVAVRADAPPGSASLRERWISRDDLAI
ncbi:4'-phosphopantetheinyl transferase family protein [Caulobacter sp. Root487D2Y]|uniref:4'-phosphopantetheinyl transferase family protein n=1 Tax=Caulobacter sp. Root487D2Y TaxID=1736547 RepID=UPI0012E34390|nr:4'-phosphopantetheinyl transferase superfamily protein [Caulobacter sp. Root487D2Y]